MLSATYILKINVHGVLYSTLPRIEPDFKRYYIGLMMIIFAFKKGELKKKTQDANFSLPIKNPIGIPKLAKIWPDSGSRIRIANPNYNIHK